jgi:hypothetical protein
MATIVTRSGKGSALTHTEMDNNVTNLNTDKIESVSQDTAPSLGGDLNSGNFVVSDLKLQDYKEVIHSLGTTDAPSIDVANGNVQSVSITSALALPAFTNAETGQSVTLIVVGSGTASGTGSHKFAGGNKTLTTESIISIFYDGSTYWTSIATDFQA